MHRWTGLTGSAPKALGLGFLALVWGSIVSAQEPVKADTVRDTSRVRELPELNVTVTRTAEPLQRVPYAVGVLNRSDIQRGQPTVGIDEALNNLPGVVVANRYNFSLDQRISIRGFGSRSNFGVRGLKILLDGVPQTLPDGQSQLTNIDFADVERAEVLRGASSSLYGNASGGVIAFQTERAAPGPVAQRVRVQGGDGSVTGMGSTRCRAGPRPARETSAARCRRLSSRPMGFASTARPSFACSTPGWTIPFPGPHSGRCG